MTTAVAEPVCETMPDLDAELTCEVGVCAAPAAWQSVSRCRRGGTDVGRHRSLCCGLHRAFWEARVEAGWRIECQRGHEPDVVLVEWLPL